MKLYISSTYYSKKNKRDCNNIFLVLTVEERETIKKKYLELLSHLIENGFPPNWNEYDDEMIAFIPKLFNYHKNKKQCIMLDPTVTQTKKIDKMLSKIPNTGSSFVDWAELEVTDTFSDSSTMKSIMDEKRKMRKTFEARQALIAKKNELVKQIIEF